MHSSLAVMTDGLPLGLCAIKFWSRQKFKGARALKSKINSTRIPIEGRESFRRLQNMQQSSDLIGSPSAASTSVIARATSMRCLPRLQISRRGSGFERVPIGSSATDITPSATRWPTCECKDFPVTPTTVSKNSCRIAGKSQPPDRWPTRAWSPRRHHVTGDGRTLTFVKPYVETHKNDAADAEAICKAVARPNIRFVPVKNIEQQAVMSVRSALDSWRRPPP